MIGEQLYPAPSRERMPLGELRLLKREYGWAPGKDGLDPRDQDHMAALVYMCLREERPETDSSVLLAMVDQVRKVETVGDDGATLSDADIRKLKDPEAAIEEKRKQLREEARREAGGKGFLLGIDSHRKLWQPWVAEVYGIRPWEMGLLSVEEWNAICRDVERKNREARKRAR
jgi:hypothetical protein